MSNPRNRRFFTVTTGSLLTGLIFGVFVSARAQTSAEAMLELPDAPGMSSSLSAPAPAPFHLDDAPSPQGAGRIHKYVQPGEKTSPLSAGDKVLLGLRGAAYPIPALGWVASAAWSQALDHSPNYGGDTKAFFQRLGAAAARSSSEGIISDSIMATALHEDPRYYQLGKGHSFWSRVGNAAEHIVMTRTDSGEQTVNYALISGNLAGSALTNAYYPARNRTFGSTMTTFGLSLAGSGLGFTVAEFYGDALAVMRPKK